MPRFHRKTHPVSKLPLTLYPHQQECVDFTTSKLLSDGWAGIIHDPGLGKTATVLRTFAKLKKKQNDARVIISCPVCTLKEVWEEHAKIWLDNVSILVVEKLKTLDKEDPNDYDVIIISRNLIAAAFKRCWKWIENSEQYEDKRGGMRWRGSFRPTGLSSPLFAPCSRKTLLVIDESHYLRNSGRSKVCLNAHNRLAEHAQYGLISTATPVCNKPEDVAGQLFAIGLDHSDTLLQNVKDLVLPKSWRRGRYTINSDSVDLFNENTHRRDESILKLPELNKHAKEFNAFKGFTEQMVKDYNNQLLEAKEVRAMQKNGGEVDIEALRRMLYALTKMSQMIVHPELYRKGAAGLKSKHFKKILNSPSPMLKELSKLVNTLSKGGHKKLVVFGLHSNSVMEIARQRLMKDCPGKYYAYNGSLSQVQRSQVIKNFLAPDDSLNVIFIQMIAGGVGLNLVPGPTTAIFIQQSWNPADHLQAYKRIHRIGQPLPVEIYNLVGRGTPDAAIRQIHEDKLSAAASVVDGMDLGGNPWRTKGRAVDLCEFAKLHAKPVPTRPKPPPAQGPHQILGVSSDADWNTIKKSYRKLAKKIHPDKNPEPHAQEAFQTLHNAYSKLKELHGM